MLYLVLTFIYHFLSILQRAIKSLVGESYVRVGDMVMILRFCAIRAMRSVTHPTEGLTAPLSKAGAEVLLKFCSEFCLVVFAAVSWF